MHSSSSFPLFCMLSCWNGVCVFVLGVSNHKVQPKPLETLAKCGLVAGHMHPDTSRIKGTIFLYHVIRDPYLMGQWCFIWTLQMLWLHLSVLFWSNRGIRPSQFLFFPPKWTWLIPNDESIACAMTLTFPFCGKHAAVCSDAISHFFLVLQSNRKGRIGGDVCLFILIMKV